MQETRILAACGPRERQAASTVCKLATEFTEAVGAEVTELIQGYVIAMNLETTEEELIKTVEKEEGTN